MHVLVTARAASRADMLRGYQGRIGEKEGLGRSRQRNIGKPTRKRVRAAVVLLCVVAATVAGVAHAGAWLPYVLESLPEYYDEQLLLARLHVPEQQSRKATKEAVLAAAGSALLRPDEKLALLGHYLAHYDWLAPKDVTRKELLSELARKGYSKRTIPFAEKLLVSLVSLGEAESVAAIGGNYSLPPRYPVQDKFFEVLRKAPLAYVRAAYNALYWGGAAIKEHPRSLLAWLVYIDIAHQLDILDDTCPVGKGLNSLENARRAGFVVDVNESYAEGALKFLRAYGVDLRSCRVASPERIRRVLLSRSRGEIDGWTGFWNQQVRRQYIGRFQACRKEFASKLAVADTTPKTLDAYREHGQCIITVLTDMVRDVYDPDPIWVVDRDVKGELEELERRTVSVMDNLACLHAYPGLCGSVYRESGLVLAISVLEHLFYETIEASSDEVTRWDKEYDRAFEEAVRVRCAKDSVAEHSIYSILDSTLDCGRVIGEASLGMRRGSWRARGSWTGASRR